MTIDLDTEEGKIENLIGLVSSVGRKIGLLKEDRVKIINDMLKTNHINAVIIFNKKFGHKINLITNNPDYETIYIPNEKSKSIK